MGGKLTVINNGFFLFNSIDTAHSLAILHTNPVTNLKDG
ncbi:hypothetical protein LCGC14_1834330 [marine sediment metagenome]|uniref:Uncharacterized protein n=1 Tax=marine sediment metagenome TaxID=412755 RepID=A0A0F9JEM0_9ZZZZ